MRKGHPLELADLDALPVGSRVTDWEGESLLKQGDGSFKYDDGGNVISAEALDKAYGMAHYYDGPDPEETPRGIREKARRAAWEEWNRRQTLAPMAVPTRHTYADAIADAVAAALFPVSGERDTPAPEDESAMLPIFLEGRD